MTVTRRSWLNVFCICLSLCATGVVSQGFQLEPQNLTVLQGSDARFNATVQGEWQFMTWTVKELLVLTVSANAPSNVTVQNQFSARFCASNRSCVEFTIHNVTREQSGPVICAVQGLFGSRTALLTVQESGTVSIMGGNVTVVKDQQVEFQCVTSAWFPTPTVSWTRNGEAVLSSLYNTTSMADGDFYNTTSVLSFQAVSDTIVECLATVPALTNPKSSSVSLVVVVPDWTVLIAVVVSFGSLALLVFLILVFVLCYKRWKEKQPSYRDEMSKRVRTQSEISGVNATEQKRGRVNSEYVPDDQISVVPSEFPDGGFYQISGTQIVEMPDIVNSNYARNDNKRAFNIVDELGLIKHRHATIV